MKIHEAIGMPTLMNQVAEECCEFAQAALKYRRTLENTNPSPITEKAAWEHFLEELADVLVCINELPIEPEDSKSIGRKIVLKTVRWKQRLGIVTEENKEDKNETKEEAKEETKEENAAQTGSAAEETPKEGAENT